MDRILSTLSSAVQCSRIGLHLTFCLYTDFSMEIYYNNLESISMEFSHGWMDGGEFCKNMKVRLRENVGGVNSIWIFDSAWIPTQLKITCLYCASIANNKTVFALCNVIAHYTSKCTRSSRNKSEVQPTLSCANDCYVKQIMEWHLSPYIINVCKSIVILLNS